MHATWIIYIAGVLLAVVVAATIASCQEAYADTLGGGSSKFYRQGISCPMVISAMRQLVPQGYDHTATHYRTERGDGWMKWVPVAYTFTNRMTADGRTVHCLGAPRGPRPVLPVVMASEGG